MPKVKLHRCPVTFLHTDIDSCWKLQRELDAQGIDYEVVKEPLYPRGRRKDVIAATGQEMLPAIEFEDGSWYREETGDMVETVRSGRLFERGGSAS